MRSSKHLTKILISSLIGVLLLAVGFWIYMGSMGKPYDSENAASVSIEIPSGTSAAGIAQTLEDNGIIANASKFRLWSKSKGWDSKYKAGTYALSPSCLLYTSIFFDDEGRLRHHRRSHRCRRPSWLKAKKFMGIS